MPVSNFEVTLKRRQQVNPAIHLYNIEVPETFNYQPGQFLSFVVAPNIRRSYSIAGVAEDGTLELLVDLLPGGPGSLFFQNWQSGQTAKVLGALGSFIYHPHDHHPANFYATSTGIAPLYPMLLEATKINPSRRLELHFGVRFQDDIFWEDRLKALVARNPNFSYQLYLSRPENSWEGRRGYIHQDIRPPEFREEVDAYICGGTNMINDTRVKLLACSVANGNIFYEKFF